MKHNIVSLFSGAMGLDIGLEQAGFKTSLAVEVDPHCCRTIRKNRPALDVWQTDVRKINGTGILERLNRPKERLPHGRRAAVPEFLSWRQASGLVRSAGKPDLHLSEAHPGNSATFLRLGKRGKPRDRSITTPANRKAPGKHWNLSVYDRKDKNHGSDNAAMETDELSGSAIHQIIEDVQALGYHIGLSVVDAADYGAPQHRLRFLLFGGRDGLAPAVLRLPTETALACCLFRPSATRSLT